jgi:hypothetical protein
MRRISEDAVALGHQLRWIRQVMDEEKLIVIPTTMTRSCRSWKPSNCWENS